MVDGTFFNESKEQSKIKAIIVAKYFRSWANVIMGSQDRNPQFEKKIGYYDWFCGPGKYEDGTKSTPLKIMELAVEDHRLCERLVAGFNDKDKAHIDSLRDETNAIPGIEKLRFKPTYNNEEISDNLIKHLKGRNIIPSLFFVDPWGYKGLSLELISAFIGSWGCDCILFFNYHRIRMCISNPLFSDHMTKLFGVERAQNLRLALSSMTPQDAEMEVIEQFCMALKELNAKYVLPFRFKDDYGTMTSHHIILLCKDFKGYEIMKNIMAKMGNENEQGVPKFEYNPVKCRQVMLFEYSRPLDDLEKMLTTEYAGQTKTFTEIYTEHSVGKRFIDKNYREVLLKMENQGAVKAEPAKRRKNTMAPHVKISFPKVE